MIKKWSYVAAAMLTVASGVALTSCIDNDEPYGITQIRVATANLLDAKKAALAAEQAAREAELAIAKINAEVEKLKVENEKIVAEADAKIKEAQAKKIEAEAEAELLKAQGQNAIDQAEAARLQALAAQAQAEADKWAAEAEKVRQETEMSMKERQAALDEQIALAEYTIKTAENTYNEAVYNFEKRKADHANEATSELWAKVEYAFGEYLKKIEAYNDANKKYLEASRTLAAFELDLVWNKDENKFESPSYDQKASLVNVKNELEKDILSYQQTIDTYDEFLTKLDEFNQGDWAQLLEEYQGKLDQAEVDYQQALLESEAVKIDQAEVFSKPDELWSEFEASRDEVVTIPTYTINPLEGALQALAVVNPAWRQEIEVVGPNQGNNEYNFNGSADLGGVDGKKAVVNTPYRVLSNTETFNYFINKFTLAMYDENDKAWTNARVEELQRQVANDGPFKTAKANWQAAKKAYNDGKKDVVASALPLAAELDKAIADYNAYEGKLTAQRTKVIAAKEAEALAQEALDNAWKTYDGYTDDEGNPVVGTSAVAKYREANEKINATLEKAEIAKVNACGGINPSTGAYVYGTLNETCDRAIQATETKRNGLWSDVLTAQRELTEVQISGTAEQIEAAQKKLDAADLAYQKYAYGYVDEENGEWIDAVMSKEQDLAYNQRDEAIEAAKTTYNEAENKAYEDRREAEKAFDAAGGWYQAIEKDPAYKPVAAADEKLQAAQEKVQEEIQAANDLAKEVKTDALDNLWKVARKQFDELQFGETKYLYEALPEYWEVENYVSSIDYTYPEPEDMPEPAEFPVAYAPVKYVDPTTQVNECAKDLVIATTRIAYGWLGYDYDQNDYATYDFMPDYAFLISDVTLETVNMYINKMLLAQNVYGDKQEFSAFQLEGYYPRFGLFGQQQKALIDIEYAKICLAGGDAILAEIDNLKTARDEMNSECEAKAEALTTQLEDYVAAVEAKTALEKEASKNVETAETKYNAYNNIVNGLKPYVEKAGLAALEEYNEKNMPSVEDLKAEMKEQKETAENKLAGAEVALAKVNAQLESYEGENGYASLDNPYSYYVDYLKGNVDIAKTDMDFWNARYQALQKQYDAAQ